MFSVTLEQATIASYFCVLSHLSTVQKTTLKLN